MLRTTTTKSAKNSPSDMGEDAEVRSGMSSTTRLAENLPLNMAKDAEVGSNGDSGDDEMIE